MAYKFRFYRHHELDGLSERELEHLSLVDRLLGIPEFEAFDPVELEAMPSSDLRRFLDSRSAASREPAPPIERKPARLVARTETIEPATLAEAFAVKDGKLCRRIVSRYIVGDVESDVVYFAPVGERVRFAGRTYRASHLLHWLQTGEWVTRTPRAAVAPRYRARVRLDGRLVHLGYYATQAERDAAVAQARLRVSPNGSIDNCQ